MDYTKQHGQIATVCVWHKAVYLLLVPDING